MSGTPREFPAVLRAAGARLAAAYGAVAEGVTLLGATGIDVETVDVVVDCGTRRRP